MQECRFFGIRLLHGRNLNLFITLQHDPRVDHTVTMKHAPYIPAYPRANRSTFPQRVQELCNFFDFRRHPLQSDQTSKPTQLLNGSTDSFTPLLKKIRKRNTNILSKEYQESVNAFKNYAPFSVFCTILQHAFSFVFKIVVSQHCSTSCITTVVYALENMIARIKS